MHLNVAREILEERQPVDLKFWSKDGEIVEAIGVICTSTYFHNNTANLQFPNGEIRKIRMVTIHQINYQEVYL